jgi:translation initiation factor 1A
MVKNTTGGNKHKGQARKFTTNFKQTNKLRVVEEEGEVYAQVTKMLGNGMCHVICIDNKTRLCFIRGKFRGRGKRDNTLKMGTWLLIGLREWESGKGKSIDDFEKCDLLEVYSDLDKERLKKTVNCNWSCFIENDANFTNTNANDEISFEDDGIEEYKKLMESEINNSKGETKASILHLNLSNADDNNNEDINIDDI